MNITDKYTELNLEAIRVAYDRYRNLYDGDWVQMGNYPEDGCSVPTEEGRKKAIQILKGLYQILIPYEQQIRDDWDSIRRDECLGSLEELQQVQTMYEVCNDYHNLVGFMESLTQLSNKPQHSNNKDEQQHRNEDSRGKGRPKKRFSDCIIDDTDGSKLEKIHAKMKGKYGKDAALIILACIAKGWITKPTHSQVSKEFGNVGSQQIFSKYLSPHSFTKDEIDGALNSLE